jgi:hypothetical protein
MKQGLYKDDQINHEEPIFDFQYGFNPLKFLADYLRWAHPHSVAQRELERKKAIEELQKRAKYSLYREQVHDRLLNRAHELQSGLVWGPVTAPLSSTSIIVLCQPLKPGQVYLEVSSDSSFSSIVYQYDSYHDPYDFEDESSQDYPTELIPVKFTIDQLEAGRKYFIRCRSQQTKNQDDENSDLVYQTSTFWTLPSEYAPVEEESAGGLLSPIEMSRSFDPVTILGLGLQPVLLEQGKSLDNAILDLPSLDSSNQAMITCVLGDPLVMGQEPPSSHPTNSFSRSLYTKQIYYRFFKSSLSLYKSLVDSSSLVFCWDDSRIASDRDLMHEEFVYRSFTHDMKKYEKKHKKTAKTFGSRLKLAELPPPPVLQRPQLSSSLSTLIQGFPVTSVEGPTVNLYRSFFYGPDIEVFVLDTRRGYLGKHQGKWLKRGLKKSQATWKILLAGTPFGVSIYGEDQPLTVNSMTESAEANPHTHTLHHQDSILQDDLDAKGRPKSSLLSIFSYLQSKVVDNDDDKSSIGGDESLAASSAINPQASTGEEGSQVLSPRSTRAGQEESFDFDSTAAEEFDPNKSVSTEEQMRRIERDAERGRVRIQSGIVVLSGGLGSPFVATYDINQNRQAYLCEVNTGSCIASDDKDVAKIQPCLDASPDFLYSTISSGGSATKSYWNSLTLQQDGSLSVKIFSKMIEEDQVHEILEYTMILTTNLVSYH